MLSKRDRWRACAASAVSAGAVAFFVAGSGPATAATPTGKCTLPPQLCGVLNGGTGTKPPVSPGVTAGPTAQPKAPSRTQPRTQPKAAPKPAAAPPRQGGSAPASGAGGARPPAPQAGGMGAIPPHVMPPWQAPPVLPGLAAQDPVVLPQVASDGQPASARLAAATTEHDTLSPVLVAAASGTVGAVAALHLSVLNRRLRRRHR